MDELSREFTDDAGEGVSATGIASATEELRKRRSTRIVQAVPLTVTGIDALGRPFTERTSTLIINCHGCRYQSKHYVLKNMWVSLEVPHPETGRPPRSVRGRVAWIQRPRTVRQLFQVALELEIPGNAWAIAFPPQDWFPFPDATAHSMGTASAAAHSSTSSAPAENPSETENARPNHDSDSDFNLPLNDTLSSSPAVAENLRVFPAPSSATDASMQLARQIARLLAEARQQIHAAAREAAAQAVAAERRIQAEEWEQRIARDRERVSREIEAAVQHLHEESASLNRTAQTSAAEALQRDLPRWLAPQLEELAHDLTAQLSQEGLASQKAHREQATAALDELHAACRRAEELAHRLQEQAEHSHSRLLSTVESSSLSAEEFRHEQQATAERLTQALHTTAQEIRDQISAFVISAQLNWQKQAEGELEAAQGRLQIAADNTVGAAQLEAAKSINEHANSVLSQFHQETERLQAGFREAAALASAESESRLNGLHDAAKAEVARVEDAVARAREATGSVDSVRQRLEAAHQHALTEFQSQLDDVLSLHRNELHRRSESLFEELSARIHAMFADASGHAASNFRQHVESLLQPHLTQAQEAVHRLAGGRAMLEAATSLQQDRVRVAADEAFAAALANFRSNLGGVEQLLRESADAITARSLADLEGKAEGAKHQTVDDLLKSAEWYEKKAQTQIQHLVERAAEQAEARLRQRAGEISATFAAELDAASNNFVGHTENQMAEVVHEAFERARSLFSEAADTTSAAFIDEIQRQARQELCAFDVETQKSLEHSKAQMEAARSDLTQQVTSEQENFLLRFQSAMNSAMTGAMNAGVAEANQRVQAGFGPLLDAWKSMTQSQQVEMHSLYKRLGDEAAEHFRGRLENVSNQWMLATVASLDRQSRDVVAGIASTAEEKLRETCTQVFSDIGNALRERLGQIAANFSAPPVAN
jgi:hypothetical protein